jgi:hypothetical protein
MSLAYGGEISGGGLSEFAGCFVPRMVGCAPEAALPQTSEYYIERRFNCTFAKEGCPYAQGPGFSGSNIVVFGICRSTVTH